MTGIDWEERVFELCQFVESEYGVDSLDTRLIATALLPVASPAKPCWLIFEARKADFWGDLDTAVKRITGEKVDNIVSLRMTRPRYANRRIEHLLEGRGRPWIGWDAYYEEPHWTVNHRSRYRELNGECLRARLNVPPLRCPHFGADRELQRLLKLVIDTEHRDILPVPWQDPPHLMTFAAHLLAKLNPELEDGSAILRNLLAFPAQHAVLHGRGRLEEADHLALYRVMRDSVRKWTWRVMEALTEKDGMVEVKDVALYTGLSRPVVQRELARLDEVQIAHWPVGLDGVRRRKWVGLRPDWEPDIKAFVRGEMRWW